MKAPYCLALVAGLVGCGENASVDGPTCADYAAPGITVTILDFVSGQRVTSAASVVARDGAYADTGQISVTPGLYALAYERSGTYSVSVQVPGHRPWSLDHAVVDHDQCHVITLPLAAYVVPLP